LNVDVLGSDESKIVRRSNGIGRDVGTEGGETESERAEKGTGSVLPKHDDLRRVPEELAVDSLSGGRDGDTDEGKDPVDEGDEKELPP